MPNAEPATVMRCSPRAYHDAERTPTIVDHKHDSHANQAILNVTD